MKRGVRHYLYRIREAEAEGARRHDAYLNEVKRLSQNSWRYPMRRRPWLGHVLAGAFATAFCFNMILQTHLYLVPSQFGAVSHVMDFWDFVLSTIGWSLGLALLGVPLGFGLLCASTWRQVAPLPLMFAAVAGSIGAMGFVVPFAFSGDLPEGSNAFIAMAGGMGLSAALGGFVFGRLSEVHWTHLQWLEEDIKPTDPSLMD